MPLISSFYGVLIYMHFMDIRQQHTPYICALYQEHEAVFAIDTADLLDSKFPTKQTRLVQAWIELRREELVADWSPAVKGQPVERVEPLR